MRKLSAFSFLTLLLLVFTPLNGWGAVNNGDLFERISANPAANDEVIFVKQSGDGACGTTQNTNNRSRVAISTSNNQYVYLSTNNVQVFTVIKNTSGQFGFHTGSGYIYSASSSNNNLKTNSTAASTAPSGTAAWTLSFSSSVLSAKNVTNTSYYLEFNTSSAIFSQYKGTQSKPYLYKKVLSAPTALTRGTITSSSVALTITDAANVNNYEIYYSTSSTTPTATTTASTTTTSKTPTLSGLTASTTYYVWVRSVGSNTRKSGWIALTGSSFTTSAASATCDYKVTLTKGAESNGTFTLSQSNGTYNNCDANFTVTVSSISPASGYGLGSVTATGGNNTVTNNGDGTYTVTYTKGNSITSTVTANFLPLVNEEVKWMANGQEFKSQAGPAGTALTDPGTPSSATYCDGTKVFVGWTAQSSYSHATTAPTDLFTSVSGKSIPAGGTTYYAVYASGGTSATRVTSTSGFTSGDRIVICNEKNSYILLSTFADATAQPVESSSSISINNANQQWLVSGNNSDGYTLTNGSIIVGSTGSSSGSALSNTTSRSLWTFTTTSVNTNCLAATNTSSGYRMEYSGGWVHYNSTNANWTSLKIYKVNYAYYATSCTACGTKVTLTKGAESNGTFTLSQSNGTYNNCDANFTVTVSSISPASGYGLGSVTATGGNNTVTNNGDGTYTVTYTKGNSITSTVTANFLPKCATPQFTPAAGTYNDAQSVTIQTETADATIYYTLDGSTPTTSSSVYTSAISVSSSQTLKAIAVKSGTNAPSDVASAAYVIKKQVAWLANGTDWTGASHGSPDTRVVAGNKVTAIPSAPTSQCDGKTFVGWSATEITGSPAETDTRPTDLFTDVAGSPIINGDVTFYAVFAKVTEGAGDWERYESGTLADGDYLVVQQSGTTYYTMKNSMTGTRMDHGVGSITDWVMTQPSSALTYSWNDYIWHIAVSSTPNYYTMYNATADKYISATGTKSEVDFGDNPNDGKELFSFTYYSTSKTFDIYSKYNTDYSVNGHFRDGNAGFSCYAALDNNKLYLFKRGNGYAKYATTCCSTFDITGASTGGTAITGGTITSNVNSACEAASVTLTATVCEGYTRGNWTIINTATSADVTSSLISGHEGDASVTFAMPAYAITVSLSTTAKTDHFIDRLHATTGYTGEGYALSGCDQTVPDLSDTSPGDNCEGEHYKFVGWVISTKIASNGTLLDGYTIITGGTDNWNASGATYYAIWAAKE